MIGAAEKRIEGSLDITRTNRNEPESVPHYNLFYLRYENFHDGAQRPNPIVGTDALKSYLVGIGFDDDASEWIKKLSEMHSISIPNVMLTEKQIAPYLP